MQKIDGDGAAIWRARLKRGNSIHCYKLSMTVYALQCSLLNSLHDRNHGRNSSKEKAKAVKIKVKC